MKKIELEKQQARKKNYLTLTSLTIGMTLLLALVQLFLSNRLAGFSGELALLEKTEKTLEHENERLQKEVASESSIAAIVEKAKHLSFEAPVAFLVVSEAQTFALSR